MQAAKYERFGPPEVLQVVDVAEPSPLPGQIKVRVRATSVNPMDVVFRSGELKGRMFSGIFGPKRSILGTDFAGDVAEVGDGIAIVTGLGRALSDELLQFASGVHGIVLDLEPGRLGVVLLGPTDRVAVGENVMRSHKVVSTKVGPALLGRVVDALGNPRDGKGPISAQALRPVEAEAPKILDRVSG